MLIESNRQRDKTASEVMHEAEHIARIIEEENRRKMLAGVTEDGAGGRGHKLNPVPNSGQGLAPKRRKTDTQVAEAVGMKPTTYASVRHVHDAANDETQLAAVRAVAQQQIADIAPPLTISARSGRSRFRRARL